MWEMYEMLAGVEGVEIEQYIELSSWPSFFTHVMRQIVGNDKK